MFDSAPIPFCGEKNIVHAANCNDFRKLTPLRGRHGTRVQGCSVLGATPLALNNFTDLCKYFGDFGLSLFLNSKNLSPYAYLNFACVGRQFAQLP